MKTRSYFFGNMYLSPIQQGIQAGHVIAEMAVKYQPTGDGFTPQGRMFYRWAEEYKVMILLNGGFGENLHELAVIFDKSDNPYPWADFCESDAALDGAMTSIGIILPAKIYNGALVMRKIERLHRDNPVRIDWGIRQILTVDLEEGAGPESVEYTDFEVDLMNRLVQFRLAS